MNLYCVNVMAMDYGSYYAPNGHGGMGGYAISSGQNTASQTGTNIGITPMIGQNDASDELFSLADAQQLVSGAPGGTVLLGFWSAGRDNGGCPGQSYASPTCSGISQASFDYVNIFKAFTSGGGCTPTAITPYATVNGGAWQQTASVSLAAGGTVTFGPQPISGSWSWSGPNGFSSSSREITLGNLQGNASYVATYTNSGGCKSSQTFSITVTGGCTPTAITPYVLVSGGSWQNTASASVTAGGSVSLGPQPLSGGSWSWSGPAGFSSTSREVTITNIQTSQAGNYLATYTNSAGCKSTQTFSISVAGSGGTCAGLLVYPAGLGSYQPGQQVVSNGQIYQVKPWPYSGWANIGGAYAPGTGSAWQDAWILIGPCQ